jgi:hypothetical protein
MNFFTEIRTETKLDYYGVPYEATVFGKKKLNLGQLWEDFKQRENDPEHLEWQKKVYVPGQYQPAKTKIYGTELQAEVFSQDLFINNQ